MKEVRGYLEKGLKAWGVQLPEHGQEHLLLLIRELIHWNRSFSFTSLSRPQDLVEVFILDPLVPLALGLAIPSPLLDAGCGPGFPSLPLKIASPQLEVMAVDSSRKKINFVRHMVRLLRLKGYSPMQMRLEALLDQGKVFPTVTVRALSNKPQTLETLTHLTMPKGAIILYVGKRWSPSLLPSSFSLEGIHWYTLPFSQKERGLVRALKVH